MAITMGKRKHASFKGKGGNAFRQTATRRQHQLNPNDEVASPPDNDIIGGSIQMLNEHLLAVSETQGKRIKPKTKQAHCNRIKKFIDWIKENYPAYVEQGGVVEITEGQLNNPTKFYHENVEDLQCEGLNVDLFLAFLGAQKVLLSGKDKGNYRSYSDMVKFHNGILCGALQAKDALSTDYHLRVDEFLKSHRKETVEKKSAGEMKDNDSDPITFSLYSLICTWALDSGNLCVWAFTLMQWNCMARSVSVSPLGFHNLSMGTDSMKCTYDNSKADQSGEKVSPKNLFANPFKPWLCLNTGLGIWISLNREKLGNNDAFFHRFGKDEAAGERHCEQLAELLRQHEDEVRAHSRPERTRAHGTRKGSAILATSGTTLPPPLPAVANRGEWSQGAVFDVYLLFAEPGDQYLGRILAGLDPNSASFGVLPPHFKVPATHESIQEAMLICFGDLGANYSVTAQLERMLASMIYHIDWIRKCAANNPEHPFNQLPLLQCPELINELSPLVSTKPSEQLSAATGIPPHVNQASILEKIVQTTDQVLQKLLNMTTELKTAVQEAIESNDVRSGAVTMPVLEAKLGQLKDEIANAVVQRIGAGSIASTSALEIAKITTVRDATRTDERLPVYQYSVPGTDQQFWHVPKNWEFPRGVLRRNGWELWLRGQPGYAYNNSKGERVEAQIRPFRLLESKFLPKKGHKEILKTQWKPIFSLMEEGVADIPSNYCSITAGYVESSFQAGTEQVRQRASYIFVNSKSNPDDWKVSNWSKKVLRSSIEKDGTAEDLAQLPTVKRNNKSHPDFFRKRKASATLPTNDRSHKKAKSAVKTEAQPTAAAPDLADTLLNVQQEKVLVSPPFPSSASAPARKGTTPKGFEDITNTNLHAVNTQGLMIQGNCVRGYLNTLVREYYEKGVRRASTDFFSPNYKGSWEHYIEQVGKAQDGTHLIDWKNDRVILVPIFTGHTEYGHFSLLIVDRTRYEAGVFFYFDSYPSIGDAVAPQLKSYLMKTPLWVEGSMFLHVRKMPVQFRGSNDCGIYACCVAAAYIRYLERAKAFDRTDTMDGKKLFAGAMLVGFTPEMFGRRARKHVSRTLKRDRFDWSDFVNTCPISVALMDEDRK